MSYFSKFPLYQYDVTGNEKLTLITDILRRVNLISKVRVNTLVFDEYEVHDGETPDIVAQKYYGNPEYHWVIITINDIKSPYDWPLDQVALSQYVNDKYSDPDGTHHHEVNATSGDTTKLLTVSSDTAGVTTVTNYEYEQTLNDTKRNIRLLDKAYVRKFQEEFTQLIKR